MKKIKIIPYGEIAEERFELSKKFDLIRGVRGIWILTEKCKRNYNSISFIEYLQGKLEKPLNKTKKQGL